MLLAQGLPLGWPTIYRIGQGWTNDGFLRFDGDDDTFLPKVVVLVCGLKIDQSNLRGIRVYLGTTPHPVTVTTRIITFLIGNPYKPSFATVTGKGDNPMYTQEIQVNYLLNCFSKGFRINNSRGLVGFNGPESFQGTSLPIMIF